jgi:hypothetical protein
VGAALLTASAKQARPESPPHPPRISPPSALLLTVVFLFDENHRARVPREPLVQPLPDHGYGPVGAGRGWRPDPEREPVEFFDDTTTFFEEGEERLFELWVVDANVQRSPIRPRVVPVIRLPREGVNPPALTRDLARR